MVEQGGVAIVPSGFGKRGFPLKVGLFPTRRSIVGAGHAIAAQAELEGAALHYSLIACTDIQKKRQRQRQ